MSSLMRCKTVTQVWTLGTERCERTTQPPEVITFYFLMDERSMSIISPTKTAIDPWFDTKEPPLIQLGVLRTKDININARIEYASSIKMKTRKMSWIAFQTLILSEAINSQNKTIYDDKEGKKMPRKSEILSKKSFLYW